MKVEIIETFDFPPAILFAVLTDVPHYVDWAVGPVELISLTDSPVKLGSIWEFKSDLLGRRLVTSSECNLFETNCLFGWITGKPIASQVTLSLEPEEETTKFTWSVEAEAVGIAQLAEPLLVKETKDIIQKSFSGLRVYLLQSQM